MYRRPPLIVAALLLAALLLTACGGSAPITAAPGGSGEACTALVARLPATVLDRARTKLTVAGTASWGDPAIVLRCGLPVGGPTSDPCDEVDGVDWTFAETGDAYRFTTYGRTPAVEVAVPASVGRTNASFALVDLASAVKPLPGTNKCIGLDDVG